MEPMRFLPPLLATLVLVGCVNPTEHLPAKEEALPPEAAAGQSPVTPAPTAAPTTQPSSGDSVQIHGMGAGAAAPVTGGESVMGGGGGGVGQAAKAQAKKAASAGGGSPLDQLGQDGAN